MFIGSFHRFILIIRSLNFTSCRVFAYRSCKWVHISGKSVIEIVCGDENVYCFGHVKMEPVKISQEKKKFSIVNSVLVLVILTICRCDPFLFLLNVSQRNCVQHWCRLNDDKFAIDFLGSKQYCQRKLLTYHQLSRCWLLQLIEF